MPRRSTDRRCRAYWPLVLLLLGCGPPSSGAEPVAAGHAVILLYHHVAPDTPQSTSVTPETFAAHLDYLADHDYSVLPLSRVQSALAGQGDPLPPRAVAITFDDGYRSVAEQAAPLLVRHGFPYAVFVTTDYVDRDFGNVMTWDTLRRLEADGAEIANHSRTHEHYLARRDGESAGDWRDRVEADMAFAQQRLTKELRAPLAAIAYPYGEFDPALEEIAESLDLVGYGQQSGPVGPSSPRRALPRFPMAGRYASLDDLAERLRTRPFDVELIDAPDPVLAVDAPAPSLRMRLDADAARLDALNCFVSGQPAPRVSWVDRNAGIVEVTASGTLPVGRSKYTCTAPARDADGIYYWYSHLWMKPPAGGGWYPD